MEIVIQRATSSEQVFLQNIYSKLSSIKFALTFFANFHILVLAQEYTFPLENPFK